MVILAGLAVVALKAVADLSFPNHGRFRKTASSLELGAGRFTTRWEGKDQIPIPVARMPMSGRRGDGGSRSAAAAGVRKQETQIRWGSENASTSRPLFLSCSFERSLRDRRLWLPSLSLRCVWQPRAERHQEVQTNPVLAIYFC